MKLIVRKCSYESVKKCVENCEETKLKKREERNKIRDPNEVNGKNSGKRQNKRHLIPNFRMTKRNRCGQIKLSQNRLKINTSFEKLACSQEFFKNWIHFHIKEI